MVPFQRDSSDRSSNRFPVDAPDFRRYRRSVMEERLSTLESTPSMIATVRYSTMCIFHSNYLFIVIIILGSSRNFHSLVSFYVIS